MRPMILPRRQDRPGSKKTAEAVFFTGKDNSEGLLFATQGGKQRRDELGQLGGH